MFGFIKKIFFTAMTLFSYNALKCVSTNNLESIIRQQMININSNEPSFFPYSVEVNKCSGSCNDINDPYVKLCVPDAIKIINVKVFNLVSRSNEKRHIEWHKTCKCKCRLHASVCNNKQCWNKDKCRSECKELIDKGRCDKGFIWNPGICDCKCDKSCDIGEYLDYKNCKFRKQLVDKLVEDCSENIDENEMIYNSTLNDHRKVCNSCTLYIVLLVITFLLIIGISSAYCYFHRYLKRSNTETTIY